MYTLAEIQNFVDEAINAARLENDISWCVNWGDLRCVDVEYYESVHGVSGYRAWIEEADPDDWKFRKYISDYLLTCYNISVEIRTEW